jgi:hypothetical protein
MNIAVRKTRFVRVLKERLFLRFHMSLILIDTALVGLLASKLLLLSLVTNIVIRYPLAVIVAYLAFFGFIKLWLAYINSSPERNSYDAADATIDAVSSFPDLSGARMPSLPTFGGGGGGLSGGGGASGSFDVVGADAGKAVFSAVSDSAGGIGKTAGDAAGDAASGIAEEAGWVLVILGILLAIVFGAGIYLVYDAPFVLTEAAFDFALSASLLKSSRKMDDIDWKGSVFRTTWKPFIIVLLISLIGAALVHSQYPNVQKLSEIFR